MQKTHICLLVCNAFSIGLLVPVLMLLFLAHGATMETLWLVVGVYSVSVVGLEIPSGIFADRRGRKQAYVLAQIFLLVSYLLLNVCEDFLLLLFAVCCMGVGRAFASGSIEAYEVEEYIHRCGAEDIEKISNILTQIECFGTVCGALLGGYLGYVDNTFDRLLYLLILMEIFIICLAQVVLQEKQHMKMQQVRQRQERKTIHAALYMLGAVTVVTGAVLSTVETYWQPTLLLLLPEQLVWLMGVISCLAYVGVALGSFTGHQSLQLLLRYATIRQIYLVSRFLLVFSLFLVFFILVSEIGWIGFVEAYVLIYFCLGFGNLMENTMLHALVDDKNRAVFLSGMSLCSKTGGIGTSLLGMFVLYRFSARVMWLCAAGISFLLLLCIAFWWQRKNDEAEM